MNITRTRAIKELTAFRKLLAEHPNYAQVPIKFSTFVGYLEAVLAEQRETRIPVRFKEQNNGI